MIAKIYQLFFQELIRYVTKMTCDKAAAEDIVQETFLRAMEHAVILMTWMNVNAGRGCIKHPATFLLIK